MHAEHAPFIMLEIPIHNDSAIDEYRREVETHYIEGKEYRHHDGSG